MATLKKFYLALALASPLAGGAMTAQAVTFGDGLNDIFFNNFENVYRAEANCTAANPCLAFDASVDPVGYRRAASLGMPGGTTNNILVGDLFVGIINAQNVDAGGSTVWFSGVQDQFTGYFVQQVGAYYPVPEGSPDPWDPANLLQDHLVLLTPTVADPFGILALGESLRLFTQIGAGTTLFESNGTIFDDIAKATDGTLWASFAAGAGSPAAPAHDTDGFMYSHVDLSTTLSNFSNQEAFMGLNLVLNMTGMNLALINDVNENEVGGVASPQVTGTCIVLDPLGASCNHLIATSELEFNPQSAFVGGNSPWAFRSNDPANIYKQVPEPGTLAMIGLGLFGLGALRRKNAS